MSATILKVSLCALPKGLETARCDRRCVSPHVPQQVLEMARCNRRPAALYSNSSSTSYANLPFTPTCCSTWLPACEGAATAAHLTAECHCRCHVLLRALLLPQVLSMTMISSMER